MKVDPLGTVPVTIRHLGDSALTVEFGDRIEPAILGRVLALDALLGRLALRGVVETVPSYRALLVVVDPEAVDLAALRQRLEALAASALPEQCRARKWELPVVYGDGHGEDLEVVAARCGMPVADYAALHCARDYTVAMIGFLPGFCYLSGLDPRLAVPRRETPRACIQPSTISVGGVQTAIGSVAGPSGWHAIGRTPVRPFDPGREPAFLFAPGDRIRLVPVSAADWPALDTEAQTGGTVARLVSE